MGRRRIFRGFLRNTVFLIGVCSIFCGEARSRSEARSHPETARSHQYQGHLTKPHHRIRNGRLILGDQRYAKTLSSAGSFKGALRNALDFGESLSVPAQSIEAFADSSPVLRAEVSKVQDKTGLLRRSDRQASLENCSFDVKGDTLRTVLQVDGSVDDVVKLVLCPEGGLDLKDVRFKETSSNDDVLSVGMVTLSDVQRDVIAEDSGCQNMTMSFSFEKMVGTTNYSLSAEKRESSASERLCSVSLSFVVAGLSLYEEVGLAAAEDQSAVSSKVRPVVRQFDGTAEQSGGILINAISNTPGTRKVLYSGLNTAYTTTYKDMLEKNLLLVRVQFLDGSNASSIPPKALHDSLTGLLLEQLRSNSSVPSSYSNTECQSVSLQEVGLLHPPQIDDSKCGFGFGEFVTKTQSSPQSGVPSVTFGFHIDPYRVGTTKILMTWQGFESMHTEFEDELYMNSFTLTVTGNPPPIATSLTSDGPLLRTGGKAVKAVLANTKGSSSRALLIGESTFSEEADAYRALDGGLFETHFISTPGIGKNLSWTLEVGYPDGSRKASNQIQTSESLLSYAEDDIGLVKISPSSGKAGDVISLYGNFNGFELPSSSSDDTAHSSAVYFENVALQLEPSSTQVESNMSRINFVLPPRRELGSSYYYDVKVLIDGEMTTALPFSYQPNAKEFAIHITVYGSRWNETEGVYVVGSCTSSSYSVSLPQGFPEGESMKWEVRAAKQDETSSTLEPGDSDLLARNSQVQSQRHFLNLEPEVFGNETGQFFVSVSTIVLGQKVETSVIIEKESSPVIGVQLFKPPMRSIRVPDTPLRINSFIRIPEADCSNSTTSLVIYDWTVGNMTKRFSAANTTEGSMANESLPARLGREYVISQSKLVYGKTMVTLKVFLEGVPVVWGSAVMEFSITPPDLVPMIGNGEIRTRASVAKSVTITGENSFDPDFEVQETNLPGIDIYKWTCEFSNDSSNKVDSAKCGSSLLPDPYSSEFEIEVDTLILVRDSMAAISGNSGRFYIHYTLQVGKDFRMSPLARQTVEIDSEAFEIARLSTISLTNFQGINQDWQKVRYYEGLFLIPGGADSSWKITVTEPATERNTLLTGTNAISRPGYYDPTSREASQEYPLGLAPNALSPGTTYVLKLTVFSTRGGVEEGVSTVSIKTLERPRLDFPNMPVISGDTKTLFVASATVNLDDAYAFNYYFYLVDSSGDEFCIDGCSGSPFIQFYIEQAGEYTVRCHLVDTLGKSTLDSAVNSVTLSVVNHVSESLLQLSRSLTSLPRDSSLSSKGATNYYSTRLKDLHQSGDHGNLELLVSTMSAEMSRAEVLSSSETEFDILQVAVKSMHQVMTNSAPSTRTSQSYVRTASRLASINSVFFASEEVLYNVLSMVNNAVTKVPPSEAFDIEKDLQLFYNRSIRHMLSAFNGFTARVRLQQFGSESGLDGRSLVVDVFRLQELHMIQSVVKGAECGMTKTLSTAVEGGVDSSATSAGMISARVARGTMLQQRSGYKSATVGTQSGESLDTMYGNNKDNAFDLNGHTTLTLAVLCNKEQGTSLRGQNSEFKWCDSVFDSLDNVQAQSYLFKSNPRNRIVFSMMETVDYVWLSGLTADIEPSDTPYLVSTNVSRLEANNSLSSLEEMPANCLRVNTTVARLGVSPFRGCLSMNGFSIQSLKIPFTPKVMFKDFQRNSSTVDTSVSTDRSSTVVISSDKGGIFGAKGSQCPTISLATEDIETPPGYMSSLGAIGVGLGVIGAVGGTLALIAAKAIIGI